MKFTQKRQITTELRGPFFLVKTPKSLKRRLVRKKFRCGFQAVAALQALNLDPEVWYGADVCDSNGNIVAELE